MSLSKDGLSTCPCCDQKSLQPNGAFFMCGTCGLAITTQALVKAVGYSRGTSALEEAMVTSSN